MAHLIKQLSLMSSKNIHIKPVIRAWNPVGGDYIYHKRKRSNFKNFTAVWNEQKKGHVGISETGRKKGSVWRLPEVEKGGSCSTHVSLQRRV